MELQTALVTLIIAFAAGYGALALYRKSTSFSTNSQCNNDCGCGKK